MKTKKLHHIKNTGFKTSKNYFEGLEDSILNQIKLKEKTDQPGFITPKNYFNSLDTKILNIVWHKPKTVSLFTKHNLIYISGIAATLVLLFNIFKTHNELTFETIEVTALEHYLTYDEFETDDIASLLTDEELSTNNFIDSEISHKLLEEYLLKNTTIEDLIIE